MVIQIIPKDIDHIIEQIEKLRQLIKTGIEEAKKEAEPFSLSANEKKELSQFETYESYKSLISELEQIRFGAKDPGNVVRTIDVCKRKLSRIPYDAKRAQELMAKSARGQGQYHKTLKLYFNKNIKPDWEQLDVFLYARQEALGSLDSQIVNQIQGLCNIEKCVVVSEQQFADVMRKLRKIKAKLELEEQQQQPLAKKPAGKGQNNTLAKEEREKAKTIDRINIQNFTGILGDVQQAKNIKIGDDVSIHKGAKADQQNKSPLVSLLQFLGWLWTQLKWLWTKFLA